MPPRLHKIALVSDDVEGAVRFYTEKLGMRVLERFPVEDDEDYVFLDAGAIILELMPQKSARQEPGFHHISFEADDIEDAADTLREKGVPILKAPFAVGGGTGIRLSFFEGPDRLNLQLFQRD